MGSSVDSDLDVDISVLNTNVLGTISVASTHSYLKLYFNQLFTC